jgi:D-beta-D-heptose 7-phosphate kinase/D-beta-D-heptose 1-phosphate adenosyltransferase
MLDCNVYTTVEKLANEAPIPVFSRIKEEYFLGGCGNVLKNLIALGTTNVYAFSVIGKDEHGRKVVSLLDQLNIKNNICILDNYITTTKQRFFCENKIVFRCDDENNKKMKESLLSISFIDKIEALLKTEHIDCIILSDYNKGVLHHKQCQDIITLANKYNIFTCVDPKHDYTKYIGCTLIKPNRREAYDIFKFDTSKSLEDIHKYIFNTIHCKYSVITLAEKGITLYDGKEFMKETPLLRNIIDVTGAGDIVCCILGYFLSTGTSPQKVLKLATHIATKSIEYPGTYTIQQSDINLYYGKRVSIDILKTIRTQYTPIVFTNGCFDLLHSGHIQLFKFCKEKGTVVVGLNSDESIRRLKGDSRPINNLQARLDILESIQYIDYIVVFEEDTPYNVLKELRPDYLVKGGDYTISNIIGREFTNETLLCDFVKGNSSTSIIQRIQML